MPTIDDLKSSKYLTKKDVTPPVLVTIISWSKENVAKEGADEDIKFAIHFRELDKPLILNVTNGNIIASILGSGDLDDWKGGKVVLYHDPNISFAGKLVGGIRARAPKQGYQEPEEEDDNIPF